MASDKKIKIEINGDVTGLRKSINTATKSVTTFGADVKRSISTFGGQSFDGLKNAFTAVGVAATAAAIGGLYAFTTAMAGAVEAAKQTERLNLAFLAITGKGQLAAKELQFVREEAARLGISFTEAAEAYKGIFAASKGTELEGKATQKIFTGIASASAALGLSAADTSASLLAVSQMISKGKISAEELRGQLGERLPPAFNTMAKAAGVSTAALDKMLEQGQVGIDLLPRFAQLLTDKYGKAASAADGFIKAQQNLGNEYFALQTAAGELVTKNTFVIESLKILTTTMHGWSASLTANRGQMVDLVKNGVLFLVDSISGAISVMRFFYNAWQGLGIVAHGATMLIIKGMELSVKAIRGAIAPLDLLLQGMVKLGAIDSNPLQNWEQALQGLGQVSAADLDGLLQKVLETNTTFDKAQAMVEEYRKKIAEIPASYKDTVEQIKGSTDALVKEVKLINGVWTNVYDEAEKQSGEAKKEQVKDTGTVGKETKLIGGVWTNVYDDAISASDKATGAMLSNIDKVKKAAASIKYPSASSSKSDGFARGGNPFWGGLAGYGGGDRRHILVEDGEHVIRKEATGVLGHGFFQKFNNLSFLRSLPRFATGGPIGAAATQAAAPAFNITLNYSGSGSQSDARRLTDMVSAELERRWRARS